MRKVVFWAHLVAGIAASLVILIMSFTGVLLTYEKQMIAMADRTEAAGPPVAGAARLPVDALLEAARQGDSAAVVGGLTISSVPGSPALATVGQRVIALNPYTGAVLGDSAPRLRAAFRTVTTWHRYLGAAAGPLRQALRSVTGWSNFLFLLIVMGGMYLWLPRRWSWAQVRSVALFRGALRGKARDFNWHNVIGIWSCVPLLLIVASALPMSFPWANNAVYRLAGDTPPAPGGGGARAGGGGARGDGGSPRRETAGSVEPLWAKAEQQVDGWRTISARFGGNGPVAFTIDRGYGGQPQLRSTVTVDRASAAVVRVEEFGDLSAGRRARSFTRFAHTGEYFGLTGQTIAGLASLGGVVLVWTGIALALRRFGAWRTRRRTALASPSLREHAA